jgi:hypothetical protein
VRISESTSICSHSWENAAERAAPVLRVGEPDAFINDVAIGPDAAAYFTNSPTPSPHRSSGWSK